MVHLANKKSRSDIEADVQHRYVSIGHLQAFERFVGTVVDLLGGTVVEEHHQEDAREYQNHEAVEGNLPQHEGPVIREDMVQGATNKLRPSHSPVEPSGKLAAEPFDHAGIPQNPGPGGVLKPPPARSVPSESAYSGTCGRDRAAGPLVG